MMPGWWAGPSVLVLRDVRPYDTAYDVKKGDVLDLGWCAKNRQWDVLRGPLTAFVNPAGVLGRPELDG